MMSHYPKKIVAVDACLIFRAQNKFCQVWGVSQTYFEAVLKWWYLYLCILEHGPLHGMQWSTLRDTEDSTPFVSVSMYLRDTEDSIPYVSVSMYLRDTEESIPYLFVSASQIDFQSIFPNPDFFSSCALDNNATICKFAL